MRLTFVLHVAGAVVALSACVSGAFGAEKYSIASDASAVIVGELSNVKRWPSLRGWRLTGTITVNSEIYVKNSLPRTLAFNFVCSCCPLWPPPETSFLTAGPGLWFLIPSPDGGWTSAGSCSDPGWRPLRERRNFEEFFKGRRR